MSKRCYISLEEVEDIRRLRRELEGLVEKRYTVKSLLGNRVKLILDNKDDYQKVIPVLENKGTEFHSFQLKDEKKF